MNSHEKEVQHFFLTIPPLSSLKATVEASVEGAFITERLAKGDMHVRWMAKKIDYQTPMFNDSVIYREVGAIFLSLFACFCSGCY